MEMPCQLLKPEIMHITSFHVFLVSFDHVTSFEVVKVGRVALGKDHFPATVQKVDIYGQ